MVWDDLCGKARSPFFDSPSVRRGNSDLQSLPPMGAENAGQSLDCPAPPATFSRRYDQDFLALSPDAEFTIAQLPSSFEREHDKRLQGLPQEAGDFFRATIRPSRVPIPDISQGLRRNQSKMEIVALAKYIQAQQPLMVHKDQLYVFSPPCWRGLTEKKAATYIVEMLAAEGLDDCITDSDARAIYRRLLIEPALQHPEELEQPAGTLNFEDGTYNILEYRFYEHRPEDYFTDCIDVCWDDVIHSPYGETFEMFAAQIGNGDPLVRQQLLELTAILLTGMELKYFFVLLGESNTGKSQFGRFLSELVGRDNVETLRSINDFKDKWSAGQISGKKLVTCLDLPDQQLSGDAIGQLKQLVGDDSMKGEKKKGQPYTFYRKPLLLCAGNYPIRVPAGEQALLNRMVIIPFSNPCEESQMIHPLYKELLKESPYIIREAIGAFENLASNNFQATRAEVPLEYQLQVYLTPIQVVERFVLECCHLEDSQETSSAALYKAYWAYANENGFPPLADNVFSRSLSQLASRKKWGLTPQKRVTGTDDRGYRGIKLANQ